MSTHMPTKKQALLPQKSTAATFSTKPKSSTISNPSQEPANAQIDKRLVATFTKLFISILLFRNSKMSLLLSELGSFVTATPMLQPVPSAFSNLLRSKKVDRYPH